MSQGQQRSWFQKLPHGLPEISSTSMAASVSPAEPPNSQKDKNTAMTTATHNTYSTEAVNDLRTKVQEFIQDVVMDAEPRPGEALDQIGRAPCRARAPHHVA